MKVYREEFHHGLFFLHVMVKIKECTFVFDLQMLYKKKYFKNIYHNLEQIFYYELNFKSLYFFIMIQISSLSWHTKSVQLLSEPVDEMIARAYEKVLLFIYYILYMKQCIEWCLIIFSSLVLFLIQNLWNLLWKYTTIFQCSRQIVGHIFDTRGSSF